MLVALFIGRENCDIPGHQARWTAVFFLNSRPGCSRDTTGITKHTELILRLACDGFFYNFLELSPDGLFCLCLLKQKRTPYWHVNKVKRLISSREGLDYNKRICIRWEQVATKTQI